MRQRGRRAVGIAVAVAVLAAWPAWSQTAGELIAAIRTDREAGRVSAAVATVRRLDERVRRGETLGDADERAYLSELELLREVLRPEVNALTSRLVAAADRLAALAPANDRGPRLDAIFEVESAVKEARPGLDESLDRVRIAAADLERLRARVESQAIVALQAADRRNRLEQAIRSYGPAAEAVCEAGDLDSAERAADAVTAAEKELRTCAQAARLWRGVAGGLEDGADDVLSAAEDASEELDDFREQLGDVRRRIGEGIGVADVPRRLLPAARARFAEVEAAHRELAGPAGDLIMVRFALHEGDPQLEADEVVRSARQVMAALESLVSRADALSAADREMARLAAAAQGYGAQLAVRERVEAEIEGAGALEELCMAEWSAADEAARRAQRCLAVRRVPAAAAEGGAPLGRPAAAPAPVRAAPVPTPAPSVAPTPVPGPVPPPEPDDVSGGLKIEAPGTPVEVSVGGAVRLRAVDMGGRPVPGARWVSTDTERAAVGADGTVRGMSEGPATVMAEAGGSRAFVEVVVVAAGGPEAEPPPDGSGWQLDGAPVSAVPASPPPTPSPAPAGQPEGISLLGETPDSSPGPAPGWDLDAGPAVTPAPAPSPVQAPPAVAPVPTGGGGWDLDGGAPSERTPQSGEALPAATPVAAAGSAGWALDEPAPPPVPEAPAGGRAGGWELDPGGTPEAGVGLLGEEAAPAPPGAVPASSGASALEGTWRLGTGGRTISFHCTGGGGVCVFGGWQPGDPATPLSPAGPGRWTGTAKVYGRSGSAGGPMQVTSVDDVELVVTVDGDRGTLRMTTRRINHGTPVDIAMTRVGGGTAPRANSTAADGPRAGPYHEFAALCRLGWAQGLASFSAGAADATIVEHLKAAGEHVMMANRTTFAPLRAWPEWQGIRNHYDGLAARLAREPGGRFREQLAVELEMAREGLADALAVQMAGEVQRRENCDSHLARAGYLMCSGQQILQIADAEERGGSRDRAAAMAQEGRRREAAARRELDALRTVRLASGSCVDLSAVGPELDAAASTRSTAASMAAADRAFAAALAVLGGLAPPAPPPPRHEILGEWCYSMFLDQKDLDHPETLCRVGFAQEGQWVVGRLVPGSCTPKKAESLLAGPPPVRDGQELLRVRKVGTGVYEGQGLTFGVLGGARVELQGDRAQLFRWDRTSKDHRRLFRCTAP